MGVNLAEVRRISGHSLCMDNHAALLANGSFKDILCGNILHNRVLLKVCESTYLARWVVAVLGVAAGKIRRQDSLTWNLSNGDLEAASCCSKCRHSETCEEFTSTELLVRLDAGFAVCEYTGWQFRLLECLIATGITSASISQGNHWRWLGGFPSCPTYRVAPSPDFLKASSFIQSRSLGLCRVMALCVDRSFWAMSNAACNSSFQTMVSLEFPPTIISTSGAKRSEDILITLVRTLYEPIKDLNAVAVLGG